MSSSQHQRFIFRILHSVRSRAFVVVPLLLTASFLVGCKDKSPEGVCGHVLKLGVEAGKIDEDKVERKQKNCVGKLEEVKEEIGEEGYTKFASCVLDQDTYKEAKSNKSCNPKDFK